jgi:peroxiredoxin
MKAVALTLCALAACVAGAQDKPPPVREVFEQLRREYEDAWSVRMKLVRQTSDPAKLEAMAKSSPDDQLLPRLLELAEKHAADPTSIEPAHYVLRRTNPGFGDRSFARALAILEKHADQPRMKVITPTLTNQDEATAGLLRRVLDSHPDRKTQARAGRLLLAYRRDCVVKGEQADDDAGMRKRLENYYGAKRIAELIEKVRENRKAVLDLETIMERYRKVLFTATVMAEAPNLVFTDLAGKQHTLKEFRGKIVLLHVFSVKDHRPDGIYGSQRRYWDEEHRGRPVVQINLSVDEKKETFTSWLAHRPSTAINTWVGEESDFFADWLPGDRRQQMSSYLIDPAGLIRVHAFDGQGAFGSFDQMIFALEKEMKLPPRKLSEPRAITDPKLSKAARAYEELRAEFDLYVERSNRAMRIGRTDEERAAILGGLRGQFYGPRALELAEKYQDDPAAFDFLALAMRYGQRDPVEEWVQIMSLLGKHFAKSDRLPEIMARLRHNEIAASDFLQRVIEEHPDKKMQARACRAVRDVYTSNVGAVEQYLTATPQLQAAIERRSGRETVRRLLDSAKKSEELKAKYTKLFKDKYEGVLVEPRKGAPMPDAEFTALDSKKFKLSDLRGKIVYFNLFSVEDHKPDFTHQREFLAQMKGKPFVIVNVSADEKKETFTRWLECDPTPAVNVWIGRKNEINADWFMGNHHTTYLIDPKGVVRNWGVFWGDLPDQVETLLAEMK